MSYKNLKFEQKESTAYLVISRSKSLNALNSELLGEMEVCLGKINKKDVRVLILMGEGHRAFVAGADIKEMSQLTSKEAEEFARKGQRVFSLLESLPLPVVGLIQGFALGGGLELALSCDILIMDDKAKIGLPEVTLGLFPAFGGTQRLIHSVGIYKAKEMIFTGGFYTAQEAYRMGIANAVVSKEKLLEKAEEYALTFKKRGPLALADSQETYSKKQRHFP